VNLGGFVDIMLCPFHLTVKIFDIHLKVNEKPATEPTGWESGSEGKSHT
jgi:hypothetical protein